tara:strand:- start:8 stop:223 length:216 start_codon:yes stop_codon:yes gene_type:complete
MVTTSKVFIQVDNDRIELSGADLTAFKAQRTKDAAEAKAIQAEAEAKVAARESALAKLLTLGLTEAEIQAL